MTEEDCIKGKIIIDKIYDYQIKIDFISELISMEQDFLPENVSKIFIRGKLNFEFCGEDSIGMMRLLRDFHLLKINELRQQLKEL